MSRQAVVPLESYGVPMAVADAATWGVTRARLRAADVEHPFVGVAVIGGLDDDVLARIDAYLPLLTTSEAFSHVSAAVLWGAQLPRALTGGPIDVVDLSCDRRARHRGVRGHRAVPGRVLVHAVGGRPVVSAADAWVQLAPYVGFDDLVAVGDRFVTGLRVAGGRSSAVTTPAQLSDALARHRGARGLGLCRSSLPFVRAGVDSRKETHLRLLLVRCGLPEPVIGFRIAVEEGLVFEPDLVYPEARIAMEYEGDHHRVDAGVWRRDIRRRELLEAAGWTVVRITADDLRAPARLAMRIRRLLERSLDARHAGGHRIE